MKLIPVIDARPQFTQVATVSRAICERKFAGRDSRIRGVILQREGFPFPVSASAIQRFENVDDVMCDAVLPLHPHTWKKLEQQGSLTGLNGLRIIDFVPNLEMQHLQMSAALQINRHLR